MDDYKQRRKFETIIVSCIMFLVVLVGVAIVSFVSYGKTRKANAEYDAVIAGLKAEKEALENGIDQVQTDEYLEEKVRNEFGMIKDGETLFIFKD
jgi:cell division protein FtsB